MLRFTKISRPFLTVLTMIIVVLPIVSTAKVQEGTLPTYDQMGFQQPSPVKDVEEAVDRVAQVVRWTYTVFFIMAAFFLLLAGFKYLSAGSTPANVGVAKKMIIYAAVAIAIAFMSIGFESIVRNFLGGNTTPTNTYTMPSPSNSYTFPSGKSAITTPEELQKK